MESGSLYFCSRIWNHVGSFTANTESDEMSLEVMPVSGRYYIRLKGVKWWAYSYTEKGTAEKVRLSLLNSWKNPGNMENDLLDNCVEDLQEVDRKRKKNV